MIPLAVSIAIPDEHTRLAHLETSASFLAAIGAAVGHHNNENCFARLLEVPVVV